MLKKALWVTTTVVLLLCIVEVALRSIGVLPDATFLKNYRVSVLPDNFFVADSIIGWKLNEGKFSFYLNDSLIFNATTNRAGNRVTSYRTFDRNDSTVKLNIYGGSHLFGFTRPDSVQLPFLLQQKMVADGSNTEVANKAVPSYGLPQMLLSLQADVAAGNKPDVALVFYSVDYDTHIPQGRTYCEELQMSVFDLYTFINRTQMRYPYAVVSGDTAVIAYEAIDNLPTFWVAGSYSALAKVANQLYSTYADNKNAERFRTVSVHTARAIEQYCMQQNIQVLFVGLDKNSSEVLSKLKSPALQLKTDMYAPEFTKALQDGEVAVDKLHQLYLEELCTFLQKHEVL